MLSLPSARAYQNNGDSCISYEFVTDFLANCFSRDIGIIDISIFH